ncbi:MAG: glycoside hydrolase family 3 C-terminal domain-containing protein [Lachnospiraceae bacterium]|nr:glycoside hydrolase family 3 C-terminal domain-containing protein [Lachnospiraceae bacterium]
MKYKELVDQLTIEEKAELVSGKDFWETRGVERLGIASMFLADGPHGVRRQEAAADTMGLNPGIPATCFPTGATVANSWNEKLGEKLGEYLGEEAAAQKVNVLLGPGINIKRNPLCGRNFEYFSEDPYLAGKMAAAYVRGIQSAGVSACVKHFLANNQETRRMSVDVEVDERTLREIYLTPFEMAVKEGNPGAIMAASNKVNGSYVGENEHVVKDILRNEWGYEGMVVTDWGGSNNRVNEVINTIDLDMPGSGKEVADEIIKAVENGTLAVEKLDECVDRVIRLAIRTEKCISRAPEKFDVEKHHRVAQQVAEESIVLLRNEERILPVKHESKVCVIGDFARKSRYQGAGSSLVNPTILDHTMYCMEESGLCNIGFEQGFERFGKKNPYLKRKACELAKKADTVLLYLGVDETTEAQGIDRTCMRLPENQTDLLNAIYEVNKNIVVILSCGSPVEMPWIEKTKAVIHGYLFGQAGARAVLRVISGDVNPSGKLAETYPLKYEDTASSENFPGGDLTVEYREGLFVGYRYFSSANVPVRFPFGFGLSYTKFEYSNLKITDRSVTFDVTNTGDFAGMETAQMYIRKKSEKVFRPDRELKGFEKVFVNCGCTKTVYIPFDDKTFRYFNVKTGRFETEEGEYEVLIGASSEDIRLTGTVNKEGTVRKDDAVNKEVASCCGPYSEKELPSYFSGNVKGVSKAEFERLLGRKVPASSWDKTRVLGYENCFAQCEYAKSFIARFAYKMLMHAYRHYRRTGKGDKANSLMMFVYHTPFRKLAKTSGGRINMTMVDGGLLMINGHFFKGLGLFIKGKKRRSKQG